MMEFSLASFISPVLRYLGNVLSFVKSKLERHYWVFYLLKKVGLESKKEDFNKLYVATIYNLINEKNKSRSIIRLFEIPEVSQSFEIEYYEKNNWTFRISFDDHLNTNPEFRNLKTTQVDIDKELSDFRAEFRQLVNKSRAPKEVESHQNISTLMQQVNSLQDGVEYIKEKLGGLEIGETDKFSKSVVVPLVQHLSRRERAVKDILTIFEKREAVFMTGSISTGKTQFSVLVFEKHSGPKSWVSLKETTPDNFFEKIKQVIGEHSIIGEAVSTPQTWRLIVLDDLPRIDKDSSYSTQFANFILSCEKDNMKVLVTSNFNLPSKISDLIPDSIIEFIPVPFLTVDETVDVLKSYGASDANCDEFKSIVYAISNGHTTITSAISKFLKSVKWNIYSEELMRLFKGDYSLELTEETYSEVVNTIEDAETRELLYRLNVIKSSFTNTQVSLIAQIDPPIGSPMEKFNSIVGLWVQRTPDEKYELSPLIERLKVENLNTIVKKKISFSLGLEILAKKKLNQFEAQRAIRYFLEGGAFNQAGFVLIVALNDALKTPEIFFDWGFDLNWTYEELPMEMDVNTKVYIRMLQLMLYIKREEKHGERITFIRNDLEKILLSADSATDTYAYAFLFLSTLYSKDDSNKSLKYFGKGVQFFEDSDQNELLQELEKSYYPEQLIWTSTRAIKSEQHVEEWFTAFESLSSERQTKALQFRDVRIAATFIIENLINAEEKKDSKDRDWNKLTSVFEKIKVKSDALQMTLLSALALKGIIFVTSEKLNDIDKAKEIGDNALQIFTVENPTARFLISDILGRQLFYRGKSEVAVKYVEEAIAMDVDDNYTVKLDTFLVMSQLLGDKDKVSAHQYIEKAFALVQDEFVFTDTQRVKVRAEYAISLASLGRIKEAIYQMEIGYDTIYSRGDGLPDFKILTLRYLHVVNYWHSIHYRKKQPDDIDGLPYEVPFRGYFFRGYTDEFIEKNWMDERPFIGTHAFLFCFEDMGDITMAKKWALSSAAINKAMTTNAFGSIAQYSVPYFVLDDKYDEAIESQISVLKQYNGIAEALKNIKNERLKKAFENAPKARSTIEEYDWHIISAVIIPITMRLIRLKIERHTRANQLLKNAIAALLRWKTIFTHQDSIEKIIEIYTKWENGRIDGQELATELQSYNGSSPEPVKTVGYLIASIFTETPQSFYLQAALIKSLDETIKKISRGASKFLLLPFLETFWFNRVKDKPEDIIGYSFWAEKSIPYYQAAAEEKKVKMIFRILGNHIKEIQVTNQLETWIDM